MAEVELSTDSLASSSFDQLFLTLADILPFTLRLPKLRVLLDSHNMDCFHTAFQTAHPEAVENPSCPFCTFTDSDPDFLLQHINLLHPEDENAPYLVSEEGNLSRSETKPSTNEEGTPDSMNGWIECACGELCLVADYPMHLDLHEAENISDIEVNTTTAAWPASPSEHNTSSMDSGAREGMAVLPRGNFQSSDAYDHSISPPFTDLEYAEALSTQASYETQKHLRLETSEKTHTVPRPIAKRLGKADLGPFHDEEVMPAAINKILKKGGRVVTQTTIGPNGRLLKVQSISNQDRDVSRAYYCHPDVTHVFKLPKEGGFCGYRNIQTVISWIQEAKADGYWHFNGPIPGIFELQDKIESAWDRGYNEGGRIETGGIKGSRKFIGTPEAQALFESQGIECVIDAFAGMSDDSPRTSQLPKPPAYQDLEYEVEQYFLEDQPDLTKKIVRTSLPPIYFQIPGHSMTIIGLEKRRDSSTNLLVFDPMYKPSPAVTRLIGEHFELSRPSRLLDAYRRGSAYLKRHEVFEILRLTDRVPPKRRWHGS